MEVIRKLIYMGKQPVISLPRGWVTYYKLQKKQTLQVLYNSIIIIVPSNHPNKEHIEQRIRDFLTEGEM